MHTVYKTQGTCSQFIEVEAEDGKITSCQFVGGCDGNTKGLSKLVVGMKIEDVKKRLDGIRCGTKRTSCPDQLCRALEQMTREAGE
ncbi:MAG: TIGR03905 family TSCPD domain-containing protein [Prevotellaceae bacterium]|nr:TIGR03905 family TSCPD domain-containing protein [Prevotellaceae bacterium]